MSLTAEALLTANVGSTGDPASACTAGVVISVILISMLSLSQSLRAG